MSAWSTRRQLSFVLFFILFLIGLVVFLIVANRKVPTCSDGIKNQSELDVDCGGECQKVCDLEVSDIVILWTRIFKVREGFYDVAAYIENPNPFAVKNYPYQFRVYDADNVPVKDVLGTINLNPHERVLVFEPGVNVGFRVPTRAFITFPNVPTWTRVKDNDGPKLIISDEVLESTPVSTLRAKITNDSLFPASDIEFSALLYDKSGNVVNVSKSHLDFLKDGDSTQIVFTWPEFSFENVASADVIPRIDQSRVDEKLP